MLVDGKVRYSPDEAFEGLDTFTYVLEDAKGEQVVGVVEVNVLAEPPPGDLDGDFVVGGGGDVESFSDAFGSAEGDGSFGNQFDLNGDGRVDFTDLVMFALILGSQG